MAETMITTLELLTEKIQFILGDKYQVYANDAFNRSFTTTYQTPYGEKRDIAQQAFDDYVDVIVAVVNVTPLQLYDLPYRLSQVSYTISFWVPVDYLKHDASGQLLEAPKFDFYGDYARLATAIKGGIDVGDYKAYMSMSEPSLVSNSTEKSGAYERAVYQVTGTLSMSDTDVATGGDFEIKIDNHTIKQFNNFVVSNENVGTILSFEVTDYGDVGDLQERAFNRKKDKATITIAKNGETIAEHYSVLKVGYISPSRSSFGKYTVNAIYSAESMLGISIKVDGVFSAFKVLNIDLNSSTENNANHYQGHIELSQDIAAIGRDITFDVEDTKDSPALQFLDKKVLRQETERVETKLTKDGQAETFFATLSVSYLQAEEGYPRYRVFMTDIGEV